MGVGKGAVIYPLLRCLPEIRQVVMCGHGPPEDRDVDRIQTKLPTAEITVFEPERKFFAACVQKYKDSPRVTMRPEAISDVDGETVFYESTGPGWSSLFKQGRRVHGYKERRTYKVPTRALDSIFVEDRIDLLWMDVQGAEHLVIEGAKRLVMEERISIILGEAIFDRTYVGCEHSFYHVYQMLAVEGPYTFVGWYVPAWNAWGRLKYCDYIFALPHLVEKMEEQYGAG